MSRRTKIIATLGPATDDPAVLARLFESGVDVVRLNFSHDTAERHSDRAAAIRELSRTYNRHVAVLVDLQGPKIRIARFRDQRAYLEKGARFALDVNFSPDDGDQTQVGCCYEGLPNDVKPGGNLLMDDGRIIVNVDEVVGGRINCTVMVGGMLSNHKGINLQGGGLSAPALSEKDRADIMVAAELEADYIAVSFPQSADDIREARALVTAAGCKAGIVAKIERAEALNVIEEIIQESDVIMIARGDLGVEIGDASLPPVQKRLIKLARSMDRIVITATQMMDSMIASPIPTRAEVFDVANSVLDGTDAIMLSAETAAGKYPVDAVEAMVRVCQETEKQPTIRVSDHRITKQFARIDEAIAMSAMYAANHTPVKAIIALTESGSTPLWMSRISSGIPIYAMTSHEKTCRKVTLYRGVYPISFKAGSSDSAKVNRAIINKVKDMGFVEDGDQVILTKGDLAGFKGGTNALKFLCVGESQNS